MRKLKKGKVNIKVMTMIAHNYDYLKSMCVNHGQGLYCSKSKEDIFQDTVLFVSQDDRISSLSTDKELIDYFCYRFRMIEFQAINDNKLLKEIPYADYLQPQKTAEEE